MLLSPACLCTCIFAAALDALVFQSTSLVCIRRMLLVSDVHVYAAAASSTLHGPGITMAELYCVTESGD